MFGQPAVIAPTKQWRTCTRATWICHCPTFPMRNSVNSCATPIELSLAAPIRFTRPAANVSSAVKIEVGTHTTQINESAGA